MRPLFLTRLPGPTRLSRVTFALAYLLVGIAIGAYYFGE